MSRDYYELLGIPRNASDKEVKQAYRRLARKLHPDVNPGSKEAEARFKEINEAYEVLSNPETRRKYDQFGENWRYADRVVSSGSRQAPFERTFDDGFDLGGGLFDSDLGDLFGRFFGGRTRTHRRTIEYPVEVNLEEAFAGTTRFIKTTSLEACNTCGSSGRVNRARCPNCGGSGTMPRLRRLEVKIPPGVDTGSRISVPGGGGEQIILRVSVQRHRRFERKGADLFAEAQVPLYDALLGGEVPVQTLKGRVMLSIPPETQNGRVFRLSGQGMPRLNSSDGRGDLYATVRVVLPSGLSEHEKAKLQELKALRVQAR